MKPSGALVASVIAWGALWHPAEAQDQHSSAVPSSMPITGGNAPANMTSSSSPSNGVPVRSMPVISASNNSMWQADFSSTPPPADLFDATDAMRNLAPPKFIDSASVKNRAIPTNNWWGNIVAYAKGDAIQPVWANPFALQVVADVAPYGLAVSYPYRSRVSGGSTGNGNANRYYAHGIVREFMFSAKEFDVRPSVNVVDWADQGVTIQVRSGSNAASMLETHLVSGMVYTTASYKGDITPKLISTSSILSINGKPAAGSMTGSKFEIVYNSGQKWVLYALASDGQSEKPVTLHVDAGSTLVSSGSFNGVLRVALVAQDSWVATLDKHKTCIVQGASIDIQTDQEYSFNWKTTGNCASGLLHFAMKHQTHTIDSASAQLVDGMVAHSTTRGALQAYVTTGGSSWKFHETQPIAESFYSTRKVSPQIVQEQRILDLLKKDIQSPWSIPVGGSYYFNGKAAQKYASLCLMANDPAIVGLDRSLFLQCIGKLREVIAPFLNNGWTNKLQYDRIYGGIVSSEGFKKNDLGADFGNTMYNDHHFHYGYWIHTAAIINFLDPSWSELTRLNAMTSWLARDVANFDTDEQFFPRFRSFDWYRGHSYSHGVTPFADGKDQESTSEDINFSYGLYLFGKVTGNKKMETIGKLMARVNAHAIKTYFLIEDANQVHPANFRPNKVTGIFFDNKVDYATWFSAEKHCIHGIQMLPISPMTEFVRTKQFVQEEWEEVLSKTPIVVNEDTGNAWLSI